MKRFLSLIEAGLYFFLVRLLSLLPLPNAAHFMGKIWRFLAPFTKRHHRAKTHINLAMPHLSEHEKEEICRKMWYNLGATFAEGLLLDQLIASKERIRVHNLDLLEHALKGGKGAVLFTAHFGNWEALGIPLKALGHRAAALYQAPQNPYVDRHICAQRSQLYCEGMLPKGHSSLKRAMGVLKKQHIIAMVADQREHKGIFVPFFGYDAPSTPFPAMLARHHHAPLLGCFAYREENSHFTIILEEIPYQKSEDREGDLYTITANMQAVIEHHIRQRPDLWMWAHRRWQRHGLPQKNDFPKKKAK